jgi:hypothetical protein
MKMYGTSARVVQKPMWKGRVTRVGSGQVRSGQVSSGLLLGRSQGPRGPCEKNVRELPERRCPNEQRAREVRSGQVYYSAEV